MSAMRLITNANNMPSIAKINIVTLDSIEKFSIFLLGRLRFMPTIMPTVIGRSAKARKTATTNHIVFRRFAWLPGSPCDLF